MKTRVSTFSLLLLLLLAPVTSVRAEVITVTFSAQNSGGGLGTAGGFDLSTGSLVRLGYFDLSETSIIDSQSNISLLDEFFTVVAEVMVGFFGGETILDENGNVVLHDDGKNFGADGAFAHSVTFDPVPMGRDGDRLSLWAFNTELIADATEHGIFSDQDWVTPSSLTLAVDLSSVDPTAKGDVYVGEKGAEISDSLGGPLNKLIVVPEPSSALLALLGGGLLSLLRRRGH